MSAPIRLLLVDDSEDDAALVARALEKGGSPAAYQRVESAAAMRAALARGPWDAVIADYVMPGFGGAEALALVRELGLDVPFILVSGAVPDETAISMMRAGCHDYVCKRDLARLAPAIRRELSEAELRRERRQARAALRFLADAGRVLGALRDYEDTVDAVARLPVPELADTCVVTLAAGDRLRVAAVARAEGCREGSAHPRMDETSLDPEAASGPARVIRTGRAQLVPDAGAIAPPLGREIPAGAPLRSYLCAPLVARGHTLGALTLAITGSDRRYGPDDLALAEELARRAAVAIDNAALYREAREAIQIRDDFLQVASHELRTPLTSLKLQIQALLRRAGAGRPLPGLSASNEELIERQVDRLSSLVDDLLDVSRLCAGRFSLQREEVDLAALARDAVERFAVNASRAASAISVSTRGPVVGFWDRRRLDQVLVNLLSNAVKFGAGAPIEVGLEAEGGRARLSVRDHGIGIDATNLRRIFGRFERAVSAHHYGGLGLGLYITHGIVEAHGGAVHVESNPGAGSTFTVELPRAQP